MRAIHVTAAIIHREGRVLAARRAAGDARGGLWEFPGGKVEAGETREACLAREIEEELGMVVRPRRLLCSLTHDYPELRVHLHAFLCDWASGPLTPREHQEVRWLAPEELTGLDWSAADRPILPLLQGGVTAAVQRAATIPVLYEDAHLVAVDKPAWAVVHPTRGAKDALVLVHALAQQLAGPVFPVHRLDRQTSGVLLLARSAAAARTLGEEFQEGRVRKSYLGLCRGVIADALTVDHPVREGEARRPAVTEIVPIEVLAGRYTLLRAWPRTGRRHQIRYHLKHLDHPLVGDTNYGKGELNRFFRTTLGFTRLALHAESLRVLHPVEPRQVELTAPLAADLVALLERLRAHRGPVV